MSETPQGDERRRIGRRRDRAAAPAPSDPAAWRAVAIVAAILAIAVIAGFVLPATDDGDGDVADVQPVDYSTSVCPEPGSVDGALTTSIITVIPGLAGQDRPGEALLGFLEGPDGDGSGATLDDGADGTAAEQKGDLAKPGDVVEVAAAETRLPALEVRTLDGLAPGLIAAQTTRDSFSAGRGLASQPCLAPGTNWWFVGGGSTAGRDSALVLVNPESTPAELEVTISGPDGPVSAPRLRGIVVEPRSRVIVRLAREAPRLPAAAWHVTVRQGRVMAALSDKEEEGFVPRGADWIPASVDPATRVLVPGVIGGAGGRQLLIHAPGELTATVQVRLITAQGSFVPSATPEVEVPGGSVVAIDLDSSLQGEDATVDLQSDLPIVAGVRQRHPGVDASSEPLLETSFTTGAALVSSVAAATGLPSERSTAVTVWVTVPDDIIEIERAPLSDAEMADAPASTDPASTDPASTDPASTDPASTEPAASGSATPSPAVSADDSGTATTEEVAVTLTVLGISPEGLPLPAAEDITVRVPRGRLVAIDVPRPEGAAWFTAVATVSGGEVVIAHRAVRRNKAGSLVTGYPWRPLRSAVVVPRAVPDPRLGIAGQ